jgi:hypothetical protein
MQCAHDMPIKSLNNIRKSGRKGYEVQCSRFERSWAADKKQS